MMGKRHGAYSSEEKEGWGVSRADLKKKEGFLRDNRSL